MANYDVAIIGGGAAGLSAALVLSRARRRVLVIDAGHPRNAPATHMHGFLSRDGMPPLGLVAAGRQEVTAYGGTILVDSVDSVDALVTETRSPMGFVVHLASGLSTTTRRLLVATGLRDELPAIPGLADRWARDVLHCPYCHGWEVRDQQLGVLWGGPDPAGYSQLIRQWSSSLVVFAPAETLTPTQRSEIEARRVDLVEGTVARLVVEDDGLQAVEMDDGRAIPCRALFVPPRLVPNNALLVAMGCALDDGGWVTTGPYGATSVPGLWVAGNVSNPRAQVITAAGEGSAAAIAINADLVDDDVRDAVRDHTLGHTVLA